MWRSLRRLSNWGYRAARQIVLSMYLCFHVLVIFDFLDKLWAVKYYWFLVDRFHHEKFLGRWSSITAESIIMVIELSWSWWFDLFHHALIESSIKSLDSVHESRNKVGNKAKHQKLLRSTYSNAHVDDALILWTTDTSKLRKSTRGSSIAFGWG